MIHAKTGYLHTSRGDEGRDLNRIKRFLLIARIEQTDLSLFWCTKSYHYQLSLTDYFAFMFLQSPLSTLTLLCVSVLFSCIFLHSFHPHMQSNGKNLTQTIFNPPL